MIPGLRPLVRRSAAGFAAGYVLLHPVSMLLVGLEHPGGDSLLSRVSLAFTARHLPMGLFFGILGAAAGFVHHRQVERLLARSQAEARARHEKERLEALVELSGAVCHELGQPLTALLTYARMLEAKLAACHPQAEQIEAMRQAAEQMAELVHRLQALNRYETVPYLDDLRIVDLPRPREGNEGGEP